MFDTDCLMMVYFHVVSASASATAQSPSITHTSPPSPTGKLTVGACHDVTGIVFCLSVQALIQYHDSSLWKQ